jgi:KDO2-lipid IV(A) lauroyltransferase
MGKERRNPRADYLSDRALRAMLGLGRRLPYPQRIRFIGWAASRVISPFAGWPQRIRGNLAHVLPEIPPQERERLVRAVPDNAGRTLAEIYSGAEFAAQLAGTQIEGPGLATLDAARDEGRPAIVVTGHFGNYDAPRVALLARGCRLAGLYRPMRNRFFNDHYVEAVSSIGEPVFPTGRQGLGQLLRHLRGGGMVGMVVDVYAKHAPELDFMGQPAPTALSAAEMALKYDAPLVPVYGIRQPDGLSFRVLAEAPIPPSDPGTMTQALNHSLAELVRRHPEQWFWIHRRWKPERQRARAAANIGP